MIEDCAKQIDLLVNLQKGFHQELYEAASKKMGRPLTLAAAELLFKNVKQGDVVIMSTGWPLPPRLGIDWLPRGECDGPSGTIALADALTQGLEAKIVFLQEEAMIPVLEKGCLAAGIRVFTLEDLKKIPREAGLLKRGSIAGFPLDWREARRAAPKVIDDLEPAALVSVEKAGRNEKDVYHAMTGRDMTATTAKVDLVFEEARSRGIPTIGSIDAGNEIGGGVIADTTRAPTFFNEVLRRCNCPCGGGAASKVEVDALVTASSSNVGAVGIAAVLSGLIYKDARVLQDAKTFGRVVEYCVQGGLLSGSTLTPSLTIHSRPVDDWDIHMHELMRSIINYDHLPKPRLDRFRT